MIVINNIISSSLAVNQEDGVTLYNVISSISPANLTISFIGIDRISTAFLNESIGLYTQLYGSFDEVKLILPSDKPLFKAKIDDVVENALLGDEYDTLVDNALASL